MFQANRHYHEVSVQLARTSVREYVMKTGLSILLSKKNVKAAPLGRLEEIRSLRAACAHLFTKDSSTKDLWAARLGAGLSGGNSVSSDSTLPRRGGCCPQSRPLPRLHHLILQPNPGTLSDCDVGQLKAVDSGTRDKAAHHLAGSHSGELLFGPSHRDDCRVPSGAATRLRSFSCQKSQKGDLDTIPAPFLCSRHGKVCDKCFHFPTVYAAPHPLANRQPTGTTGFATTTRAR